MYVVLEWGEGEGEGEGRRKAQRHEEKKKEKARERNHTSKSQPFSNITILSFLIPIFKLSPKSKLIVHYKQVDHFSLH